MDTKLSSPYVQEFIRSFVVFVNNYATYNFFLLSIQHVKKVSYQKESEILWKLRRGVRIDVFENPNVFSVTKYCKNTVIIHLMVLGYLNPFKLPLLHLFSTEQREILDLKTKRIFVKIICSKIYS